MSEKIRDLTDCLGILYDRLADERFTIHPISVMFSFNRATTQTVRTDICDYWSKEVCDIKIFLIKYVCDYWSKEVCDIVIVDLKR